MAKILFVSDNLTNECLGIMYLSAHLKANAHQVSLLLLCEMEGEDGFIKAVERENPDLVGFSVMTQQVPVFRRASALVKAKTGRRVIWGGPHPTFMPENVTLDPNVDILCVGEAEDALLGLMNALDRGEPPHDLPNFWFREGDSWKRNPVSCLSPDLDQFPHPDRGIFYNGRPMLRDFAIKRFITQRGCPFRCSYCFEPAFHDLYRGKGPFIRRHSVSYVLQEMKEVYASHPTRTFHFSDDSFNLNKEWLAEFTARYPLEMGVPFSCNISVPHADEGLIRSLKMAGCVGVTFGVESGDEKIRHEVLHKKIANAAFVAVSKLLRAHKLPFAVNVMVCLPTESAAGAIESLKFCQSLGATDVRFSILKAYKGTPLSDYLLRHDLADGETEFTVRVKDQNGEFEKIRELNWTGYAFIKIPGALKLAPWLLAHPRILRSLRFLIALSYLQQTRFFRIPLWQTLRFWWRSRTAFSKGLGGE